MPELLNLIKKTGRAIAPTVISYYTTDNKQVLMSFENNRLKILRSPNVTMYVEEQSITMGGNVVVSGRDPDNVPVKVMVALE